MCISVLFSYYYTQKAKRKPKHRCFVYDTHDRELNLAVSFFKVNFPVLRFCFVSNYHFLVH